MKQKVLNKMHKLCKLNKIRFGQMIAGSLQLCDNLFYITDAELEKRFNAYWKAFKPQKDRGGYYPHGHQ